ncbi:hypothetical protein [Kamptonema formosum]|nr:hypothetical protein [Oscillatoria sp. PCC 10802]
MSAIFKGSIEAGVVSAPSPAFVAPQKWLRGRAGGRHVKVESYST